MKNKIILFFPAPFSYNRPWKGVPLSLLAISRLLNKEQFEIKIISRFLNSDPEDDIAKNIKDSLCLGITAMTGFQILDGLKIAKLARKANPKLPIIWGGWHPSILPKQTLESQYVDLVIRGCGDRSFYETVNCLRYGRSLDRVRGIGFKKDGKLIFTEERPLEEINSLPRLPYNLIDIEKCLINTEYGERTLSYISSYGCPFRCGFCVEQVVNQRAWVAVSAENVVEEWKELAGRYQIDSIAIYDSNFFVDEKRVYDICLGLLKNKIKLKWGNANGRVSQLVRYNTETWEMMQKSGCSMILTGAESGSQRALNLISKDLKVNETVKLTKICKKYQIKLLFSFLIGLPWSKDLRENQELVKEEFNKTLDLINKLLSVCKCNRFTYYLFLPYPGAAIFNRAIKFGLRIPKTFGGWGNYLLTPEDAFRISISQKWISLKQSRRVAMLSQYIFGLMDQSYYHVLRSRVSGRLKLLFLFFYKIGQVIVNLRWRLKYFDLPIDYWIFTKIRKYSKLV